MKNNNDSQVILIIDDDPNNIEILEIVLEEEGYEILIARDGTEGWEVLQENKEKVKIILLDYMMPNMNGLEFMEKLKAHNTVKDIPVIMQTAAAEKYQIAQGIKSGVYYYLTKPYERGVMLSIVKAAIYDYSNLCGLKKELKQFKKRLHLVKEAKFEAKNLDEVRSLSAFISNFYPNPEKVLLGISEMILNALEHGNLGITYDEKTELINNGIWEQKINEMTLKDENKSKSVNVHFKKDRGQIILEITDEGAGFNWKEYLDFSPDRATDSHGRGIALSLVASFDSIEYIDPGNKVICTVQSS